MVGVLIQTMPMLSFSVHRVFVMVWGGCPRCRPLSLMWILQCLVRTELVPALEEALTCHLCPCPACFHGTCRRVFPGSPLPLCQVCCHLPSGWQRAWAAPRSRPAGSRAIQAPLETMPKPICRALPSLRESWSHWECREGRLICLISPVGKRFQSLCLVVAGPQCHSSVQLDMDIPRKEHSSWRSATNHSWCYRVFSPVTVEHRQRVKTPRATRDSVPWNSSMSALSTCQIINPLLQCTWIQFATLSSFGITL